MDLRSSTDTVLVEGEKWLEANNGARGGAADLLYIDLTLKQKMQVNQAA